MNPFKNKSVILIGPAGHITKKIIDTDPFDIVARVGAIFPISEALAKSTGTRCDFWYPANSYLDRYPEICADPHIQKIRITKTGARFIPEQYRHKWSPTTWPITQLIKVLGCYPNRGLRAMIDILNGDPAQLHIVGFTFYQSKQPYFIGYCNSQNQERIRQTRGDVGKHKQAPQIQYFKKHILPHVSTDIELLSALEMLK